MGQVRWTEKASANLQSIFECIAKDSRLYAARYVKSLIRATGKLENMPFCGRVVPELENPDLREVIYGNYRIIYRVVGRDKNVQIIALVHGAREVTQAISEDWEL
jgi:toxin ParE1/3/4